MTALQWASLQGHHRTRLLDKEADVNVQGGKYGNALLAAVQTGYLEFVQRLLDKGANANSTGIIRGNVPRATPDGGDQTC
ncbi:hypothetical protein TSTA_098000 [Talaromyces stipitatus ATCC 10500]|uniref:Uncharacterized protein n=1 Tax=Talaromyces stipitatus (strain ATCC 10500 / CBS 375.48 / QM 6759 / NRRL 1006) TaxID=441959 RepID=B8MM32_TALSN|nr:uncharacterized protein TSTA_098000 [Talaromyces stipitatus ATCC 10500]EED13544.1 hypothetical protein TSTA_098000 [Talaromyces stipitatus ATCC 10500]